MIRVAGIDGNDCINGIGVSVSLYLQGCPFHCQGCHNPETWDPNGGKPYDYNVLITEILDKIGQNGIHRNLNILGGEPLNTQDKIDFLNLLLKYVKQEYPEIKIILWTGYTWDKLQEKQLGNILNMLDYLIEGPFILAERDITLKWRGSRNQNIINLKTGEIEND